MNHLDVAKAYAHIGLHDRYLEELRRLVAHSTVTLGFDHSVTFFARRALAEAVAQSPTSSAAAEAAEQLEVLLVDALTSGRPVAAQIGLRTALVRMLIRSDQHERALEHADWIVELAVEMDESEELWAVVAQEAADALRR